MERDLQLNAAKELVASVARQLAEMLRFVDGDAMAHKQFFIPVSVDGNIYKAKVLVEMWREASGDDGLSAVDPASPESLPA